VHYCDRCGDELDNINEHENKELCDSCYEETQEESEDEEEE
jgi:NMD protein affecting ribosome stability and mRNA decay